MMFRYTFWCQTGSASAGPEATSTKSFGADRFAPSTFTKGDCQCSATQMHSPSGYITNAVIKIAVDGESTGQAGGNMLSGIIEEDRASMT